MVQMNNSYSQDQKRVRNKYFRNHPEKIKTIEDHLQEGFVKDAFKVLNLVGNELVLDLGAGNCWASQYMAKLGCKVVAFDCNLSDIQGLRAGRKLIDRGKSPYFDIVYGDWNKLPFKTEVFDVIFCFQSLHHSSTIDSLVCNLYALLKMGKRLVSVGDPTAPIYIMNRKRYAKKHQSISTSGVIYDNYYSIAEYLRAYRGAGFSIQIITTTYKPLDFLKSKRLNFVSWLLTKMKISDDHPFLRGLNTLLQPIFLYLRPQSITIIGIKLNQSIRGRAE